MIDRNKSEMYTNLNVCKNCMKNFTYSLYVKRIKWQSGEPKVKQISKIDDDVVEWLKGIIDGKAMNIPGRIRYSL